MLLSFALSSDCGYQTIEIVSDSFILPQLWHARHICLAYLDAKKLFLFASHAFDFFAVNEGPEILLNNERPFDIRLDLGHVLLFLLLEVGDLLSSLLLGMNDPLSTSFVFQDLIHSWWDFKLDRKPDFQHLFFREVTVLSSEILGHHVVSLSESLCVLSQIPRNRDF